MSTACFVTHLTDIVCWKRFVEDVLWILYRDPEFGCLDCYFVMAAEAERERRCFHSVHVWTR